MIVVDAYPSWVKVSRVLGVWFPKWGHVGTGDPSLCGLAVTVNVAAPVRYTVDAL